MKFTPILDPEILVRDHVADEGVTDSGSKSASHKEACPPRIDGLLAAVSKLYQRAKRADKNLLKERIEIGGILIQLKERVGHGNFLSRFREWVAIGKLNFSLSTGDRAMAYAALEAVGKLRKVTNLAEAERVRKAELARRKAEKRAATAAGDGGEFDAEESARGSLTRVQVARKAKQFATPILEECRAYDAETQRTLLSELIELLTKKLER